jgi:toxin CcdB
MSQFDVYENANPETRQLIPYLLDVQADVLADLATRVVVPLIPVSLFGKPAKHLHPEFMVKQTRVVMSTAELAGVSNRILGHKVCSLKENRDEIMAALDFLLIGFSFHFAEKSSADLADSRRLTNR